MRRLLPLLLLSLSAPAAALPASGTRGVAATAHPAATEAALEMLEAGGTAADAACAAAFTLAVVEPYSSGIGGGGFALVKHGEALVFLDFREVAPKAATTTMFLRDGVADPALSRDGPLSAGVPGAVAGYLELQRRWGKLPRSKVLAPAIRVARKGFLVDAKYRDMVKVRLELLAADPEAARIFLVKGPTGWEAPPLGHRLVQKDLAETLTALAKQGPAPFYEGGIARKLAADMKSRGGLVTAEDLAGYRVRDRAPLTGTYRGRLVASSPPPSAGGQVVLTLLNALESLPPGTPFRDEPALHRYVEASKRAFADRALLGDPSFVPDPTPALVRKERAAKLVASIGARATPSASVPPGAFADVAPAAAPLAPTGSTHTTHLSIVDEAGNAVALTTTVNYSWGAGIVAGGTGVLWNDQMDDFAAAAGASNTYGLVGSRANEVAPGKVPLSSMSPTMVFEGPSASSPLRLVIGSPGGPRIPTTVAQAIVAHLAHGADVARAIALGRVNHQHLPDTVF